MSMPEQDMEEEQAEMLARAITHKNVKKMEEALAKTKKHGKGFVLTSRYAKPSKRNTSPKQNDQKIRLPIVIGSPIGSPSLSRKSTPLPGKRSPPPEQRSKSAGRRRMQKRVNERPISQPTYLTEYMEKPTKVDMAIQSVEVEVQTYPPRPPPTTPDQRSEIGEQDARSITQENQETLKRERKNSNAKKNRDEEKSPESPALLTREEPEGAEATGDKIRSTERRISAASFKRLDLPRRPDQFKSQPREVGTTASKQANPEPPSQNVWVTTVPQDGGKIRSPFYIQIDLPCGALRGDVIMKFETQAHQHTKLVLDENDKLCSHVVDVNINPLTYCLHKLATVRMRVLEDCFNKHDDVIIVSARHFQWRRVPTRIEAREVNGELHYYAVAETQYLGKFAVITSKRLDRFVMTTAGGTFSSTVLPDVKFKLDEGIAQNMAHLVEMSVIKSRHEAVTKTNEECGNIQDVTGRLIATSPLIELTKDAMGRSGLLDEKTNLPGEVRLSIPITSFVRKLGWTEEDSHIPWRQPTIKVMKRTKYSTEGAYGRISKTSPEIWEDITANQSDEFNPVLIQNGVAVSFNATIPNDYIVLVFGETDDKESSSYSRDVSDVCDLLLNNNRIYNVALMLHHKVGQPEIISIHVVYEEAADLIMGVMKDEWVLVDPTKPYAKISLKERDMLDLVFRDGIRLTINQMSPEIEFHSRKWQGHQFQIEATDESFSNSKGPIIGGYIDFFLRNSDEDEAKTTKLLHTALITIPTERAKPYKPTVITRPMPIVNVFREYKLNWLKVLSKAEQFKYQSINTP